MIALVRYWSDSARLNKVHSLIISNNALAKRPKGGLEMRMKTMSLCCFFTVFTVMIFGLTFFASAGSTRLTDEGIVFPDGTKQTTAAVIWSNYAPVPRTGQTTSYRANDDGDLKKGVAWPSPRFTDNEDGTVTDNLTSLVWLKDANCDGHKIWNDAVDWAANLCDNCLDCGGTDNDCGLSDGSVKGDWRLPNVKELFSLIDSGQYTPALPSGHPFTSVQSNVYWSSTTIPFSTGKAWYINVDSGSIGADVLKTSSRYKWPVRGGQ